MTGVPPMLRPGPVTMGTMNNSMTTSGMMVRGNVSASGEKKSHTSSLDLLGQELLLSQKQEKEKPQVSQTSKAEAQPKQVDEGCLLSLGAGDAPERSSLPPDVVVPPVTAGQAPRLAEVLPLDDVFVPLDSILPGKFLLADKSCNHATPVTESRKTETYGRNYTLDTSTFQLYKVQNIPIDHFLCACMGSYGLPPRNRLPAQCKVWSRRLSLFFREPSACHRFGQEWSENSISWCQGEDWINHRERIVTGDLPLTVYGFFFCRRRRLSTEQMFLLS